ncbi:restriction endonuclease subunit S [Bacillus cytotoxicus]|uniref:restriction endonuclease subunit S n=1 Tax=Bacillus cytotoxicus TaxID=580165 RepID=UPI0024490401|nr:restriction endonuclease subunit S [Bacillus cytotoxicus]MDH2879783.1 restriction endonuclease subunit S [Bacillus cytotoxicus]
MGSKEWCKYKLSDLIYIIGGGTPKTTISEYWGGGIPWLSVKDFAGDNRYVYYTEKTITEEGLRNSSTKLLNKGDLIISARGTVGEIAQLGEDMTFNQSCYGLRANQHITNDFLYYLLKYTVKYLKNNTHGSVFDTITKNTFANVDVTIPDLPEQGVIANILSALDEKIETNNQINKKLEEMAQAIFKQWFFDFEFPNEEGKPYKANGGEMVESELGMIPKGWEIKILDDLSQDDIICGKTPSTKKKENYGDFMPFVTIPDMHNNTFIINTSRSLSREGVANQVKKTVPKYSVMVSCIATPGLVSIASRDCQTNQQINTIICPEFSSYFIYFSLKNLSEYIRILGSSGSTTLNLNKREFGKIKIVYPNQSQLEMFYETVKGMFEQILNNQLQNKELTILRDTLLPKLMSGEIRVSAE